MTFFLCNVKKLVQNTFAILTRCKVQFVSHYFSYQVFFKSSFFPSLMVPGSRVPSLTLTSPCTFNMVSIMKKLATITQ
jgi:hypothetical protein